MKRIVIFILVIVILQGAWANEYYMNLKQRGDNVLVNNFISLTTERSVSLKLPQGYKLLETENAFEINENFIEFHGERIIFSYVLLKSDSFSNLDYFFIPLESNTNFSTFLLDFILDENYLPKKELLSPSSFELISYENMNVLSWKFSNITRKDFKIILEKKESHLSYYIGSFILLGLILSMSYKVFKKKNKTEYLLEDEKKFLDILRNSNRRENWQRKLQETLGFSKAKTSRMVRNLESRGLIEKIPIGNTNKIKLK